MYNPGGISLKSIFIKSGISLLILGGIFFAAIWIFGDKGQLNTELRRVPSFSVNEVQPEKIQSPAQGNLTKDISGLLAQEILEKNPSGPQSAGNSEELRQILALNPEEFVSQSIEKALEGVDIESFRPSFSEADILLSLSSDAEAEKAYFNAVTSIYAQNFEGVAISQENIQSGNLNAPVLAFEKSKEEMLGLVVPKALADFHIRSVELLIFQENLLRLVANFQEDPLMAYLAYEKLSEIAEEVDLLNQEIDVYMKKLG
ncbi:MAG: hypothetical protein Q8P45_02125 [Candidatus Harrisonbacteria bacterium]|nr:hypothetical protein [Candidatus Harrisonbacteria bacterium]